MPYSAGRMAPNRSAAAVSSATPVAMSTLLREGSVGSSGMHSSLGKQHEPDHLDTGQEEAADHQY